MLVFIFPFFSKLFKFRRLNAAICWIKTHRSLLCFYMYRFTQTMSAKIRGGRGNGPKDNEIVLGFTNGVETKA